MHVFHFNSQGDFAVFLNYIDFGSYGYNSPYYDLNLTLVIKNAHSG